MGKSPLSKALALVCALALTAAPMHLTGAAYQLPPPVDLNVRVVGTASFHGRSTALIQDANTSSDSFYRVGDPIYGYKILEISREGVLLEKSGSRFFIAFRELPPATTAVHAAPAGSFLQNPEQAAAAAAAAVSPNFYLESGKGTQWDLWSNRGYGIPKANDIGGRFAMPLTNFKRLSSKFGYRVHPISGGSKMHKGIDLSAKKGTKIFAADSGRVTFSGYRGGYGYCVVIDHHNGYSTLYGHCSKLLADVGDNVRRGDYIGDVGATGAATGPHLHFEVRLKGNPIDPGQFFKGKL